MSDFHYGLVHEPVAINDAMKLPDAKGAVGKEWDKLRRRLRESQTQVSSSSTSEEARKTTPNLRNISKQKGESRAPGETTSKTTVDVVQYSRSFSIAHGNKILGFNFYTSKHGW